MCSFYPCSSMGLYVVFGAMRISTEKREQKDLKKDLSNQKKT